MSSEKSSFSQTCSLLRQYLKENGSIGQLSLGMSSNLHPDNTKGGLDTARPVAKTMDLFPISDKVADGFSGRNKVAVGEPEAAQMTIFYAGRVIVVDDLSADKAKEIMSFAGQQNQGTFAAFSPGEGQPPPSAGDVKGPIGPGNAPAPEFGSILMPEDVQHQSARPIVCDLPIKRKASLHRFLEKRKDRITRTAPYQTNDPSAVFTKPAETDKSIFSKPATTNPSMARVAVERDLLGNISS